MVLSRAPQWVCHVRVCVVMEEHTALGCYRFPCPLWQSWYIKLTVLTHLFLPCPFLNIYNQYSPRALLIRPFNFALMTLLYLLRKRAGIWSL